MSDPLPPTPPRHTLPCAFACAFAGIWTLLRGERNPRIQLVVGAIVVAAGAWLGLTPTEWCLIVICIAGVLAAETLNSAVERAVDHTSLERHPLARQAKDLGAAAVLIVVIGAAIVGVIVFVPKLIELIESL